MSGFKEWFYALAPWEIVVYAIVLAFLVQLLFARVLLRIASRTKTDFDDKLVAALRMPLFMTVLVAAFAYAWRRHLGLPAAGEWSWVERSLVTIGVFFWTRGAMRIADTILDELAERVDQYQWIDHRSLRIYAFAIKTVILGASVYIMMWMWSIDLTAWLASAGIIGIAIGFAARETLANLFAGLFLMAEAPYKEGDFIVLDSGERGRVTKIGIRSTRLIRRDDVEVTLPNIVIASSKITNESGGRHEKRRVTVDVGIAYGTDIDHARQVLIDVAKDCELLMQDPTPSIRFRLMGDSALIWNVRGWVAQPLHLGRAIDELNTKIYKRLAEEGIEIPFPQRVVHLEQGASETSP